MKIPVITDHFNPTSLEQASGESGKWSAVKNCLISTWQSGFRPNYSTSTALIYFLDKILSAVDHSKLTGVIYLDLKKAFDTIDHDLLLQKIARYGIKINEHKWFIDYLMGRTQVVEIEGELSKSQNIEYGVPQGSILGPIFVSLYINNLSLQGIQACIIMYTDNTVIVFSHTDYIHIQTVLNNELSNVKAWLDEHKLTLNTTKSKYMIFGSLKRLHKVGPMKIEIGDEEIERVKSFKYLGVYLDEVMTYKEHASNVVKKISSRIGVLSKVVRYVTLDYRNLLLNTIVLPHFDYCSQVCEQ